MCVFFLVLATKREGFFDVVSRYRDTGEYEELPGPGLKAVRAP
jgi:hypothetical protein